MLRENLSEEEGQEKQREGGKTRSEMKSMRGEVVLHIPAAQAWEMYRNNEIISQINPDMLAKAEYLHGDGSPGSMRLFKLGPGIYCSLLFIYLLKSTSRIR